MVSNREGALAFVLLAAMLGGFYWLVGFKVFLVWAGVMAGTGAFVWLLRRYPRPVNFIMDSIRNIAIAAFCLFLFYIFMVGLSVVSGR